MCTSRRVLCFKLAIGKLFKSPSAKAKRVYFKTSNKHVSDKNTDVELTPPPATLTIG